MVDIAAVDPMADEGLSEWSAERAALTAELADFLYHEADLVDTRRFDEWLELFSPDYRYAVPIRMNVLGRDAATAENSEPGRDICWFDEGRETLELRIRQLKTEEHWAEEPLSRVSHLISNVRVVGGDPTSGVVVSSRVVVARNRVEDSTDLLIGQRRDGLRRNGTSWLITSRYLLVDQAVLSAKNLSFFL